MTTTGTLVIGAGPAGLAVAACLARAGLPYTLIERAPAVGASWRGHYDRLHLHTPKQGSHLPGLRFPSSVPRYPSRDQVVAYLEAYAAAFGLQPQCGQEVASARYESGEWIVRTSTSTFRGAQLVVATGLSREPVMPVWPGRDDFRGSVSHSATYRNGTPYRGQDVLVVGFGNSGGEIAIDLVEHGARVAMAVRSPVNVVPREILGIPAQRFSIAERGLPPRLVDAVNGAILRVVRGDLSAYGLRQAPFGPATQIARRARIPLIDIGTVGLIKQGRIAVHPGVDRFTTDGVVFADGAVRRFDAVVLATGYRAGVDAWLEGAAAVCDDAGTPRASGDPTAMPGLYFCGFRVTATGALREVGLEAMRIARATSATPRTPRASP